MIPLKRLQIRLFRQFDTQYGLMNIFRRLVAFFLIAYPVFYIIGNSYFGYVCISDPDKIATWIKIKNENNTRITLNLIKLWGIWQINSCVALVVCFLIAKSVKNGIGIIAANAAIVLQLLIGVYVWSNMIDHSVFVHGTGRRRLNEMILFAIMGTIVVVCGLINKYFCKAQKIIGKQKSN